MENGNRALKICKDLHIPPPIDVMLSFEVAKDGLITHHTERAKSWTRNQWNANLSAMLTARGVGSTYAAGAISAKNMNGSVYYNNSGWFYRNPHSLSILVGTGDTAFDINDYKLDAVINDGFGPGELTHQSNSSKVISYDNTPGSENWECEWYRQFNNNSGDSVTVKETGLFQSIRQPFLTTYNATLYDILFERTVLVSPVVVADGAMLTVTYILTMDFSAID